MLCMKAFEHYKTITDQRLCLSYRFVLKMKPHFRERKAFDQGDPSIY